MLRRLLLGLVEGLVIGLALGVAAARVFGLEAPGSIALALLAAAAGFLVGLVAGRPVWARDAKTEALLKAGAGAVVGFGLSFALRRWLTLELDLSAFSLGVGAAGRLSALALPAIATVLALFFELDDDGKRSASRNTVQSEKRRIAAEMPDLTSLDDEPDAVADTPRTREKR